MEPAQRSAPARSKSDEAEPKDPLEVEVNLSRSQWLDDTEVPVTSKTPDPLVEQSDDPSSSHG
jgi:hypothetical protein